jgi:methionyl-tRNA formyltransferase
MRFGKINHYVILGGGPFVAFLCKELHQRNKKFSVFTSPRHLEDLIDRDDTSFETFFNANGIPLYVTHDISTETEFLSLINESTLVIGIGQAWTVIPEIITHLNGRFVDFMGIPLPQNRGGAHYTWQILSQNRLGACNIETVDEFTRQGIRDTGVLIKSLSYFFPAAARKPIDYFEYATEKELNFMFEFIEEVEQNLDFKLMDVDEHQSTYFPRLNTLKNGFINWNWSSEEIERFICAFDQPYPGAATMIEHQWVRIKNVQLIHSDGPFHPFQVGLIYRIIEEKIFVATKQGTLVISEVNNEEGVLINSSLKCGQRFFTPQEAIEKGLTTTITL